MGEDVVAVEVVDGAGEEFKEEEEDKRMRFQEAEMTSDVDLQLQIASNMVLKFYT